MTFRTKVTFSLLLRNYNIVGVYEDNLSEKFIIKSNAQQNMSIKCVIYEKNNENLNRKSFIKLNHSFNCWK